jgi:hypothetical protein
MGHFSLSNTMKRSSPAFSKKKNHSCTKEAELSKLLVYEKNSTEHNTVSKQQSVPTQLM